VIPRHNEQDVIETTHGRLIEVLPTTGMDFEIIYVDDGSRDATLERLERIATREGRVTVIELSRNFGQQAAMSAGLAAARGDAIVITDADLQDPPEVIPEMVTAWRRGVDVAFGRRRRRDRTVRDKAQRRTRLADAAPVLYGHLLRDQGAGAARSPQEKP